MRHESLSTRAASYRARGFKVIPLKGKVPWNGVTGRNLVDWTTRDAGELKIEFAADVTGIGIALGQPSGGLTDVDLDTPEAIALAPLLLPPTRSRFGRASARESHREYIVRSSIKTTQFRDIPRPTAPDQGGTATAMLVEIRSTGAQTMFPGSVHPNGETVEYAEDGDPAVVDAGELLRCVSWLAAATLIARSWPQAAGTRHLAANALAGFLLRRTTDDNLVVTLIAEAARTAGDEEWRERGGTARATARSLRAGRPATGGPTAATVFGEIAVQKLREWVGHPYSADSASSAGSEAGIEPSWEPPTSLEGIAVPQFPTEVLPSVLRNIALDVATVSQVPVDLPALLGLGVAGAAVARRFAIQIGQTHKEPLNLYVAAVAGSGERKGPALRGLLAPLESWQARRIEAEYPAIRDAMEQRRQDEERLQYLRSQAARSKTPAERSKAATDAMELAKTLTQVPSLPMFLVNNTTPEKLEMLLAEQDGAICMASEEAGAVFEIAAGRYSKDGGAQFDTLLLAYDGGRIATQRVTRADVDVSSAALSILLTPQPVVLQTFRDHPEFTQRGLVARFMFAVPKSLVGTREYKYLRPNEEHRAAWEAVVHQLLSYPKPKDPDEIPILHLEPDALAHWVAQHDQIERAMRDGERLAGMREWTNKHPGRVARIAGILHLLAYPQDAQRPISFETMRAAWCIGRYLVEHALAAHDVMGADARLDGARAVLKWIGRTGITTFSKKELFDALRMHFKRVEALTPALDLLIEHAYLRLVGDESRSRPGRKPSPRFEVNPFAHNSQNTPIAVVQPVARAGVGAGAGILGKGSPDA